VPQVNILVYSLIFYSNLIIYVKIFRIGWAQTDQTSVETRATVWKR